MERREGLHLLLAHGITSFLLGFIILVTLAFSDFPFKPGSFVAIIMTFGIFAVSFFCSAKLVSHYLTFSHDDVRFLLKLVVAVGLSLIVLDICVGGTKFATLFSNLSYLGVFVLCSRKFLKPKTLEGEIKKTHDESRESWIMPEELQKVRSTRVQPHAS